MVRPSRDYLPTVNIMKELLRIIRSAPLLACILCLALSGCATTQQQRINEGKAKFGQDALACPKIPVIQKNKSQRVIISEKAQRFRRDNPWYDAKGGDTDSRQAIQISINLINRGLNPADEKYWDKLTAEINKKMPQHARRGHDPEPQDTPVFRQDCIHKAYIKRMQEAGHRHMDIIYEYVDGSKKVEDAYENGLINQEEYATVSRKIMAYTQQQESQAVAIDQRETDLANQRLAQAFSGLGQVVQQQQQLYQQQQIIDALNRPPMPAPPTFTNCHMVGNNMNCMTH